MMIKKEIKRKNELLEKYRRTLSLSLEEAIELREIIKKDDSIDESIKLLLIFSLSIMEAWMREKHLKS